MLGSIYYFREAFQVWNNRQSKQKKSKYTRSKHIIRHKVSTDLLINRLEKEINAKKKNIVTVSNINFSLPIDNSEQNSNSNNGTTNKEKTWTTRSALQG